MKFTLLTHQKEHLRADNSGALLAQISDFETDKLLWQRTQPDEALVAAIESGEAVLLARQGDGEQLTDINNIEHLIILDGTWQEARKIYNKSGYLQSAKWFSFEQSTPSRYSLRRNQVDGGLCTAECAIEVLKLKGLDDSARKLEGLFEDFLGGVKVDITP
jgi:DTW domain-containing protein YfiP